jgi:hypothetical protein
MATTTPNYGWDVPTSTDYVKDGAVAIETLGDDIDATLYTALGGAYPGLRLIKKQTVGAGVSSVSVTAAFSATYESYRILYVGGSASTSGELYFSLNGITSGYYSTMIYVPFGAGTIANVSSNNQAILNWCGAYNNTTSNMFDLEIHNPFASRIKFGKGNFNPMTTTANHGDSHHFINSTASATAFTITASAGTITGGTIYVYGYGAS